jgi:predicted DCC family thiol-disulfide oxidoreductase YuxK
MKTLKKHVIIYDDECPLCELYTGGFVKSGMLDECGRTPFRTLDPKIEKLIDRKRACNEIALVNKEEGLVLYGTESLFAIIGNSFPFLKILFRFRPFIWLVNKLYSFISYNRKVIIPGAEFEAKSSCVPDYNRTYRWAYIIVGCFITAIILNAYSALLNPILPFSMFSRELAICGGQIIFQGALISFISKDRLLHYLGNMMSVSLMGALLLLPALILNRVTPLNIFVNFAWFGLVVGLMFLEHWRRVKILEIHWLASVSWVLYRLIVLWIIFK